MRTKQNKIIKILLAVALMFTAFLTLENTVHAKTKEARTELLTAFITQMVQLTRQMAIAGKYARNHTPIQGLHS